MLPSPNNPTGTLLPNLDIKTLCEEDCLVCIDEVRYCMRPLKLLVYEALRYWGMRPYATSVCGLQLLVYAAFSY